MKVLVFGANGKTGGLVVERAVATGHDVSVLVRDASKYGRAGVRVIQGDATKAEDVKGAMEGQEAAMDSIGGTMPWKATTLEATAVRNIVGAMRTAGARRLIVVSSMGVGESAGQSPWWYRDLLVPTFLRGSTADKTAMESELRASGLEWVIARPPILKDGAATGSVRVLGSGEIGHSITRAGLAEWLVEQLVGDAYVGQAVTVVNR